MKIDKFIDKMLSENLDPRVINTFHNYYKKLESGEKGMLSKNEIKPPADKKVVKYDNLVHCNNSFLNKLVVIKLNGGLGTSMGLTKAKSLLRIKDDFTFLDIIAKQVINLRNKHEAKIPLVLMNSFNTRKDSLEFLEKYNDLKLEGLELDFVQNKFPKIIQEDLTALNDDLEKNNWNPPGHGDIYNSLAISGLLDQLLEKGYEYIFVSNSDNLGAVVDPKIVTYFAESEKPFMMEVCSRTEMDKKGGHLAETKEGKLILRETAQCPQNEINEFQNVSTYKYFNTNNLWINLKSLKKYFEENDDTMILPMIVNPKEVNGTKVYQLESAMGSAIYLFDDSVALEVPRSRFVPVKTTNEMLLVWSDAFKLNEDFQVEKNDKYEKLPTISLDKNFYKTIDQLDERFKVLPNFEKCKSFNVIGNIYFNNEFKAEGDVELLTEGKLEI